MIKITIKNNTLLLIILVICITLLIINFNPRTSAFKFELQHKNLHINTETIYETQKEKAIKATSNQ